MKKRALLPVFLLLGLFSMVSVSCKKSILNNLEGSWAMVPINDGMLLGDDGTAQDGWEVWEFSSGTLSIAPFGGAKRFISSYKVADLFIESRLIVTDMTKDGIGIVEANDKAYEQYQTTWTIVKLNSQKLVLFSQKSGGLQREFLRQ
jgi:hypothetical protein